MPTYKFRMLCMNNPKSCQSVKELMNDFKDVHDVDLADFDHVGIQSFKNDKDALKKLNCIRQIAGKHLLHSDIIKTHS